MKQLKHFFTPWAINIADLQIHAIGVQETMLPCIVNRPTGTGDLMFMFFHSHPIGPIISKVIFLL